MLDLIIRNGRIYDGTGNPWFWSDIGISDGLIVEIGNLRGQLAGAEIDAAGRAVAPGFIDIHSHSDIVLLANPRAESKIRQGVTTEVIGQCGYSVAPLLGEALDDRRRAVESYDLKLTWQTMKDYLQAMQDASPSVNVVAVTGHGTLRRGVVGSVDRPAEPAEIEEMRQLLRESLLQGSWGFSTGLIYPPGTFAGTDELTAISQVLGEVGGTYMSHIRGEGDTLLESVAEAIRIGEEAGAPVQISHHKAIGRPNWGKVKESLAMIEAARERGVEVTCDQYPYVATSTGLSAILPNWVHDGGAKAVLARLRDAAVRARIKAELDPERERRGGWHQVVVSSVRSDVNREVEGKTLVEIAHLRSTSPAEAAFDLLVEEELDVGMIGFGMCEEDVVTVMTHPITMIGSDGSSLAPYGRLAQGKPHPRNYGTFPRVLGKYVREEKVLSLEEAIRKMTAAPGRKLGLWNRGLIRPGKAADLTVFDPDTVEDVATFIEPHRYPRGIEYVVVNGQVVIDKGEHTGARPGRVLLPQWALRESALRE